MTSPPPTQQPSPVTEFDPTRIQGLRGEDPSMDDWEFGADPYEVARAIAGRDETVEKDPNAMYMYDPMDPRRNYTFAAGPVSVEEPTIGTVYGTEPTMDPMLRGEPVDDAYEIDRILYNAGVDPVAREFDGPGVNAAIPIPFETPTSNVPTRWSKFIPW